MGQQRDVRVVRLVTRNSIEQHMVNVADQKRCIADATITGNTTVHCILCLVERTNLPP